MAAQTRHVTESALGTHTAYTALAQRRAVKTDIRKRNGVAQESVKSVLRDVENLWWEGFVKRYIMWEVKQLRNKGLRLHGERVESMNEEATRVARWGRGSEKERIVQGWRRESRS